MVKNNGYKYGIDIKKEYRIYKSIDHKKGDFKRYSHWKKHILDKYQGYQDAEYIEDIKRYLNQKMFKTKIIDDVYNTIMVPFLMLFFSILVVMPSIIISISQYSDSVLSDIMDTYKTTKEKIPTLFLRKKLYEITNSGSLSILLSIILIASLFAGLLLILSYSSKRWVNFYMDYIEILDEKKNTILKN